MYMTTKEETAPQQFIFDKEHFPNYDSWHPYIGIQARLSLWALRTSRKKNWRLRANSGEGYSWKSLINILNSDEESKESEKEREEKKEKKQFIIDSWSEILYRGQDKASKQELIDIFTDFATRKRINDDSIREMVRATKKARKQETKERDAARAAERTTVKGTCILCGKDVLSTERRLRDRGGDYVHSKCAPQKSQVSQPESLQKKVHEHCIVMGGGRRKTKKRRRKTKKRRRKRKTKRKKRKTKKRRRKRKTKRR
jgi:hypothetical protein